MKQSIPWLLSCISVCWQSLSVGVYVLYCADLWFSMLITFLFLLGTGIHLYYIQMKQLQMMRRLTDSLRYNDMTQAFRPPYKNKLMTEMAVELSETLQAFSFLCPPVGRRNKTSVLRKSAEQGRYCCISD